MSRKVRRTDDRGVIHIDVLNGLQKGDKVYVSFYNQPFIRAVVKMVRIVDCAIIITVESGQGIYRTRFVGYHTSKYAYSDEYGVLVVSINQTCDGREHAEQLIMRAREATEAEAEKADALHALEFLKNWLNKREDKH